MRKNSSLAPAVVAVLFAAVTPAFAADVLTVGDIERIVGVHGVQLAPRNPARGAGGDLNFTGGDGKLLVMVRVTRSGGYTALKKKFFSVDVPAVADEAFAGPPGGGLPYVLYFRKGDRAASVTTYLTKDGEPKLSLRQLADLARVVASRI